MYLLTVLQDRRLRLRSAEPSFLPDLGGDPTLGCFSGNVGHSVEFPCGGESVWCLSLPLSSPSFSLCVSPLLKRTPVILGQHPILFHYNQIWTSYICRRQSSIKLTFWGIEVWNFNILGLENTIQPIINSIKKGTKTMVMRYSKGTQKSQKRLPIAKDAVGRSKIKQYWLITPTTVACAKHLEFFPWSK